VPTRVKRLARRAIPKRRGAAARRSGRRLHESIEQFRLAQGTLGIVTWIWDVATDRVQWQGDCSRLLGLPAKTFSGRFDDYLKAVHPEDAATARSTFIDCLKGRTAEYRTAERVIWPDGSVHWLETYGRAEYARGRAVRMVGVIKEITERKRQESARLKAEALLGRVFDASPDYIVVVRADDGTFVAANEAFRRVTGYGPAEIAGRTVGDLKIWAIPGERDRFLADLRKAGRLENRQVLLRRRDGQIVTGRMSASLIEHEGERLVVSLMHDVTEKRRLERRASQSERKYAALFETSPVGLVVTLPRERRILEINSAALRIAGVEREQAIGALTTDIVTWDDEARITEFRTRALAGEAVPSFNAKFIRRDGGQREVLVSGTLIELEGEPHFVISILDVTDTKRLEHAARQAEHKFAALFENSPEPISLMRLSDEVRLAANNAWERVTGHSREGASRRPATAMSMFRSAEERAALIARVAAEGHVSNVELKLVRADGGEFDALISGVCLEIDGERCILWNWRDVSAQRAAERERREADARYRAMFTSAFDGMVIRNPQGIVLDANPASAAITGYSREELVGQHLSRIYDPQELAERPLRGDAARRWSMLERTVQRKDRGRRAVEVAIGPLPDGNILGIMRDITERRRAEEDLRTSEKRLQETLDNTPGVAVQWFDRDGRIQYWNKASELLYGVPAAAAVGRSFLDIGVHTPQQAREFLEFIAEIERKGAPHGPDELTIRMPGRAEVTVLYTMFMIPGLGGGSTFVCMDVDITDRKRAEALVQQTNESLEATVHERTAQLEDANQELESYNFSISHDLRQPLNAITGFADLLRDQVTGEMGEAARECVAEIESNALRMEQMIESLLRLSRAGRGALRRETVDARALVDSVMHDLSAAGSIDARIEVGTLPPGQGDPVLLRQVFANLIGNAIKYSRKSAAPRVSISGAKRSGAVEYTVRDNGVGFDMKHAERLFDAFQRLPSSKGFEGSGIGLAIVQRIVRRHGGTIAAESAPGEGATFRFTLPDKALT